MISQFRRPLQSNEVLNGVRHTGLAICSSYQLIRITEISQQYIKTVEELKSNTKSKQGHNWTKLGEHQNGLPQGKLEKYPPNFFQTYLSLKILCVIL